MVSVLSVLTLSESYYISENYLSKFHQNWFIRCVILVNIKETDTERSFIERSDFGPTMKILIFFKIVQHTVNFLLGIMITRTERFATYS